jgi:hypothetical protein
MPRFVSFCFCILFFYFQLPAILYKFQPILDLVVHISLVSLYFIFISYPFHIPLKTLYSLIFSGLFPPKSYLLVLNPKIRCCPDSSTSDLLSNLLSYVMTPTEIRRHCALGRLDWLSFSCTVLANN